MYTCHQVGGVYQSWTRVNIFWTRPDPTHTNYDPTLPDVSPPPSRVIAGFVFTIGYHCNKLTTFDFDREYYKKLRDVLWSTKKKVIAQIFTDPTYVFSVS